MAIQLQPSTITSKSVNLKTISDNTANRIKRTVSDLGHKYTEVSTSTHSKELGMEYIDLYGYPIDSGHLTLLSKKESEDCEGGVFLVKGEVVYFGIVDPKNPNVKAIIQKLKKLGNGTTNQVKVFLISKISLDKIIKTYDKIIDQKVVSENIDIDANKIGKYHDTINGFGQIADNISTTELLERIFKLAIDSQASDIHFEPEKEYYTVRLRLDGVLHHLLTLSKLKQKYIESRLKILSKVKINVEDASQDGRFTFVFDSKEIDVRASFLPSNYGYSIVMRLLGTDNLQLELDQLGFTGNNKLKVLKAINKPQGLILTTGPTGSGKTTTLYTFLKDLNDGENKIITLEDPVEYKIEGLSQTQINPDSGYTFADGLKSILRQDPDIVMVGEIRDLETAETAVQASFTGHLVLSTIHTNDATGSIPRLLQMGLPGYLIAEALSIAIGQRLVRKLCQSCKYKKSLNEEEKNMIIEELGALPEEEKTKLPPKLEFWSAKGCSKCNNIGYKGRTGVYEVLEMNDGVRSILSSPNLSFVEIRRIARGAGMITMFQDGILKCLSGTIDLKELVGTVNR
jgi:type II secretory ATPase GspE/PulE/Tfp pilus assembly ATPase PilB-like protein